MIDRDLPRRPMPPQTAMLPFPIPSISAASVIQRGRADNSSKIAQATVRCRVDVPRGIRNLSLRRGRRRRRGAGVRRAASAACNPFDLFAKGKKGVRRSEEHTSELQSLMRISYAVFCLKEKKKTNKY